ncbi:MAG: hypothetical protein HZA79_04485 [Sphingobacteriales bacterium]|nr:hypothetical protein [Sphingobacteriales bacterium]
MPFRNIYSFINEIDNRNKAAYKGAELLLEIPHETYLRIEDFINKNQTAIDSFKTKKINSPKSREELIKFLHTEFIYKHKNLSGWFGLRKKLLLKEHSTLSNPIYKKIFDDEVEPLIEAFENYEDARRKLDNTLRETTLIVTALPLEFRAVVRRLSFLIDVEKEDYYSRRLMKIRNDLVNPLDFVFDKDKDGFIHPDSKDNDPHDRPFYIFAKGVFCKNGLYKKVHVILLPNYGPYKSGKAMSVCDTFKGIGIKYSEIIVAGIAGGIDKGNTIHLGDLVISNKIFGSETKKASQSDEYVFGEPAKEIEFRSIDEYEFEQKEINFAIKKWKPTLLEPTPDDTVNPDEKGFNEVFTEDYVSIDTLSKSTWFKKKLWDSFPTCKAIEMEAFGVTSYLAEKNLTKEVRVIKSICDYGDFRKNKIWQPYCADVAASFVEDYLIEKYGKPIT